MHRPRLLAALCAAALLLVVPGSAQATPPAPKKSADQGWRPTEPVPPFTFAACGTQVTLADLINEVEERVTETASAVIVESRGQLIVKATTKDGRRAFLDASGPATFFITRDARTKTETFTGELRGRTLIAPENKVQEAALRKAGIPVFALTKGTLLVQDVSRGEGENTKPVSAVVLRKPEVITDACSLLTRTPAKKQ